MSRPCYIFFSTDPTSKLSKAIRDLGDGKVSHAGILFWSDDFGHWQVIEAIESGWVIRGLHQFQAQGNQIVKIGKFNGYDLFSGVRANKALIGVPYDWNALVGRGVIKWWHALTGRSAKTNPWNDKNRFYCNEIIAGKVLPAIGINIGNVDMDPFQLAEILGKHPAFQWVTLDDVLAV